MQSENKVKSKLCFSAKQPPTWPDLGQWELVADHRVSLQISTFPVSKIRPRT